MVRDCVVTLTPLFCDVLVLVFPGLGVVTLGFQVINFLLSLDVEEFSADVAIISNVTHAPTNGKFILNNTIRICRLMCPYFIYTLISNCNFNHP